MDTEIINHQSTYCGNDRKIGMKSVSESLQKWLGSLGNDLPALYLVGGAVRDLLLQRPVKDLDLMCDHPKAFAGKLAGIQNAALVPFLKKADTPCFRVVNRSDPEDFLDLVPIHGGSVTADLKRRDFTINAMALRVNPGGRLGNLIDPLNGHPDLRQGIIRVAGRHAFTDDPLRILRAVRFAVQLGFIISEQTLDMMRSGAQLLNTVAAERIWAELLMIFDNPRSTPFIRLMDDIGVLETIFPEINAMKVCRQNAFHHLDVWQHSLKVMENCEAILQRLPAEFGETAGAVLRNLKTDHRGVLLKLAALLHDAGKPVMKKVDTASGNITFHGHDDRGAQMAGEIAERLKMPNCDRELVQTLVANHMHALFLSRPAVKSTTILRWFRKLNADMIPLIILSMADCEAALGPESSRSDRERHIRWAREAIRSYHETVKPKLEEKPLITGYDLMALGMQPGPEMGRLLKEVRTAQDEGRLTDRRAALRLAKKQMVSGKSDACKIQV